MKKSLSFFLAIVLVVSLALTAQAAAVSPSVPVITTPVVSKPVAAPVEGTEAPVVFEEDFVIAPTTEVSVEVETAVQEVIVAAQAAPVITFFEEAVQEKVAAILPESTDLNTLTVDEVSTLKVENYKETYGDVTIEVAFTTAYTEADQLVVMVGVIKGETTEWYPVEATVVNGNVQITLTQELLQLMETYETVIALLRAA
ncbi:MAG: hypothetical protein E7329_12295 [Clostridiales bacterium]|nr:hypothetical protein [Clostridiales bacterium]